MLEVAHVIKVHVLTIELCNVNSMFAINGWFIQSWSHINM